jgi:hypothetical protein
MLPPLDREDAVIRIEPELSTLEDILDRENVGGAAGEAMIAPLVKEDEIADAEVAIVPPDLECLLADDDGLE